MKHDFSAFGKRIQAQRKKMGLTQAELGEKVWSIPSNGTEEQIYKARETARKKIHSYENGNYPKDYADLCRICDILDCSMDYLFGAIDCPTWPLQQTRDITGLTEQAIEHLCNFQALSASSNSIKKQIGSQYTQFYSKFITDLSINGMLALYPGKVLEIKEYGLSENEELVFDSDKSALEFYYFTMSKTVIDFLDRYFANQTLYMGEKEE